MPVPSVLTNALGLDSCFLSHMNTMWLPQLNWPKAHKPNFMSICFSIMIIYCNNALVATLMLLLFQISLFSNYGHSVVFRSPTVPANIFITVKATWPVRNSFSVIACFCSPPQFVQPLSLTVSSLFPNSELFMFLICHYPFSNVTFSPLLSLTNQSLRESN